MSRAVLVVLTCTFLVLVSATLYVPLMGTPWERAHGGIGSDLRYGFQYGWIWDHWHVPHPGSVPPPPWDDPRRHELQDRAIGWHVVVVEYGLILVLGLVGTAMAMGHARRRREPT